jgi:hypothetical protein
MIESSLFLALQANNGADLVSPLIKNLLWLSEDESKDFQDVCDQAQDFVDGHLVVLAYTS